MHGLFLIFLGFLCLLLPWSLLLGYFVVVFLLLFGYCRSFPVVWFLFLLLCCFAVIQSLFLNVVFLSSFCGFVLFCCCWGHCCLVIVVVFLLFLCYFLAPHQRRRFFVNCFCPKDFDCPTCSQLRAFSGSPWARELQNTLLEQTSTEGTSLWGLCVDFWFCSTDSGVDSHKKRCGFLFRSWRGFRVDFFSPFFPVPKTPRKIHARIHTKIHANFENIFPTGFSGCSALVYVAAIGCLHVNKPRLASLTLRARNLPVTQTRDGWFNESIFKGKNPRQIHSALAQP